MLKIEDNDGIELMRIQHGKANAVDSELLEGLGDALREVAARDARALVITGSGSIFSAGVDLFKVLSGGIDYLDGFVPLLSSVLREVFEFPKPLVAAMNGHAIAGGCILACACDYKVMAEGSGGVGVPELRVGVPFPAVPLEIVRMVVPRRYLQEVVLLGRTYEPEDARERGLVDEVVSADDLEERALEIAFEMASVGADSFALSKRQLRRPVLDAMDLTGQLFDDEVEGLWKAPGSHEAIRTYLEKTVGKG
ncbi:MAG: enoyl-CoA hydratase/isomerase family protein [Thermoanaerobaculia bacterium]